MRDENFEVFIGEYGEATFRQEVPKSSIEKWTGVLPNQLLSYWKQEGWCAYQHGLFWTVNPDDYQDLLAQWLEGTPLQSMDTFAVIARSGFGTLHLWGEKTGGSVSILCSTNSIICTASDLRRAINNPDKAIRGFFGHRFAQDEDMKDSSGKLLFARARKKLGDLGSNDMYGFEPALVLGGELRLENLAKVNLDVHLTLLRGLAAPTLPFAHVDV